MRGNTKIGEGEMSDYLNQVNVLLEVITKKPKVFPKRSQSINNVKNVWRKCEDY